MGSNPCECHTVHHMSKRKLAGTDEFYIRNSATFISMVKENKSILLYSILFYSILLYMYKVIPPAEISLHGNGMKGFEPQDIIKEL